MFVCLFVFGKEKKREKGVSQAESDRGPRGDHCLPYGQAMPGAQERPHGFRLNVSPQQQHQAGYDNSRGPVSEREEHFFFMLCCLTAKHGDRPQSDKPNSPASTASWCCSWSVTPWPQGSAFRHGPNVEENHQDSGPTSPSGFDENHPDSRPPSKHRAQTRPLAQLSCATRALSSRSPASVTVQHREHLFQPG